MSRIPKKPLPMALRSTTPETTVLKSNKNLPPVKTEPIHKVPGLLPKSKIESGPILEKDMVPSVAAIHEEANGSVKLKNSQISPSSFGGTTSTFAKPSALRMPSPSVGFFTQENAHMSHSNSAQRNAGRFSSVNSSSLVKPPRYKQSEDLKTGIHLSKLLSTSSTTASNLISRPVTTDSNTNTLVGSEKRSLSKIISTYSAKSRDANYQERPEVYCLLAGSAGSAATTQPLSSEKNDGARNSMPIVYNDTSHVEGRGIIKEIEPTENSLSLKATCLSTFEVIDDSFSLKATCSIISPIAGSNISSQTSYLSCQSKSDSGSVAEIDLESSCVGERGLAIPMSDGDSCDLDIDSSRNLRSCDDLNTECALMEYTIHADQMTPRGNSSDGMPALADRSSVSNDSLCDEGNSVLSEEANNDGGTELEINNASALTEDPLLQMGPEPNHTYKGTKCSPVQQEAPKTCVERQHALSVEPNMEDEMVSDSYELPAQDDASHTEKDKAVVDRPRTNTILGDHLKNLVPFTEEWLAVMEACGQEVLEQKSGAVQNSPPDKSAPEPSPWSPVKRKAQDVGPFDCTKYSKSVRTSVSRNCKI